MIRDARIVPILYRKLLALYPRGFRERLGEAMEQTFQDLWNERRRTKRELLSFVLWSFSETAISILSEHLLLLSAGAMMQTIGKTIGASALISFLLILPLAIMEVVNRRAFDEGFPFMLFLVMWLNLLTISLILLPIVRGRRAGIRSTASPAQPQRNTLLIKPAVAAIIGVAIFLAPALFMLLDSLGWVSLDRLFNGPDPEQAYLPGQIMSLLTFAIPMAAGSIAGGPIVRTLRAGGSLFAHPINLIVVAAIVSIIAVAVSSLVIDQWPCFIGVPTCD